VIVDRRGMHTDQLTRQERQVVLALLHGSSNRELADQLFVSVKTIETHLTRIYRKLECRSRSQLIAAYYTGTTTLFGASTPESDSVRLG
jgi:DNA-binding NarL/FixJ family response regulator